MAEALRTARPTDEVIELPAAVASVFGLFIGERAPVACPGAPWLLAALLLAAGVLIAWRHAPRAQPPEGATGERRHEASLSRS